MKIILPVVLLMFTAFPASSDTSDDMFSKINVPKYKFENEIFFPHLGKSSAPVVIDYYYSYDCNHCAITTQELIDNYSKHKDMLHVVFHPVVKTDDDYNYAIAENAAFSEGPIHFLLAHATALRQSNSETIDFSGFVSQLNIMPSGYERFLRNLNNGEKWSKNISLNTEMYRLYEIQDMPLIATKDGVLSGKHEYGLLSKIIEDLVHYSRLE